MEKKSGEGLVMDRKWWTWSVCNVDSVCTNRVHPFPVHDVLLIPGLLLIFLHGCEIKSGRDLGTRVSLKTSSCLLDWCLIVLHVIQWWLIMAGGPSCFLMYLGYFVVPRRVSWCFIVSFDISFSHCVSWCWVCCQHEHFGLWKIWYMLNHSKMEYVHFWKT